MTILLNTLASQSKNSAHFETAQVGDLFGRVEPPVYPDVPGYRRSSDTSKAAAAAIAPSANSLRGRCLALLLSGAGRTADEVASALDVSILSARPRIAELAKIGLIEDGGGRRPNASGHNATVWIAKRGQVSP